ncbi:MAG: hypothetical protein HY316_10935 [Acidobacteria bacterium]|nr:hypothetical protein [Acidobacteriota bacterium]
MSALIGTEEPVWKRFLTPWKIAAVLLAVFLISQAYLTRRDRVMVSALDSPPAFATPELKLEFSKNIPYDPLSFVGRGARAGFWTWTPQGLELTPEGSKYFRMDGDRMVSQAAAGRRRFSRLRERTTHGENQQIVFFYQWEEITPATAALLFPPPKLGEEYLASAVLVPSGDAWQVSSLETRDFDEPLAHLQSIASGVLQ